MYSRPSTASGFCLQGLRRTDYGTCRQGLREPVALRHRVMAIFGRALKQVGENGDVSTKLKRIVTGLDSSKEIRNQIFYLLVKIQLEHHRPISTHADFLFLWILRARIICKCILALSDLLAYFLQISFSQLDFKILASFGFCPCIRQGKAQS